MNEKELNELLVTDKHLAALVGVSPRRIRALSEVGILQKAGRGRYVLGESFRALLEHAEGSSTELQRAKLRKLNADAERSELQLAKDRGEVAPIAEFEKVWTHAFSVIRTNMRNIPQRVVIRIVGETQEKLIKAALWEEIDAALAVCAEADFSDYDEKDEAA